MKAKSLKRHTSSTASINCAIRAAHAPHVKLYGGRGYQYFVYSDKAGNYDTRSEYVYRVCDLSVAEWVALAKCFNNDVGRVVKKS